MSALACTGEVGVEDQIAISIMAPVDGAVVRRADDVSGAAGIQVDVVVKADGVLEGTRVIIGTSANPIGLDSAVVEGGEARFSAFTLPRGELTLSASTETCNTGNCFASVALTVVDSDTVVSIAKPTEGQNLPVGDVELSVARESGAQPQSCRIAIDGRGIGNFAWENQAQPLTVFSSLPAGAHTVQAFCNEGLDTIPTQVVSFMVGGTPPPIPPNQTLTVSTPTPAVFNGASDLDPGTPGLQIAIAVDAAGFEDGDSVVVCSTLDAGSGELCSGGGFVVGRGEVAGGVVLLPVTLAEGVQTLHVEADGNSAVASATFDATVDTVPPVVTGAEMVDNDPANDLPGLIRLSAAEYSTSHPFPGTTRQYQVRIFYSGLDEGGRAGVRLDPTTSYTAGNVGTDTFRVSFIIGIPDGRYSLTFHLMDLAGNVNDVTLDAIQTLELEVDQTPDVITFAGAQSLFTRVDGDVVGGNLVTHAGVGVFTSVTGNGGGTVTLEHYASASGGVPFATTTRVLASGQRAAAFDGLTLPQGPSYVEALYSDITGNVARTTRRKLVADFTGPTLALGVRSAAGVAQVCDSAATACLADTRDLSAGRIALDRTAAQPDCGFGPCSTLGTDLFFALSECVNSDPGRETCPVTVRLQSRKVGDTAWANVFNGVFSSGDTIDSSVLTDPRFDPGTTRELRLVTQDSNGNPAVSNSVFLTLNLSGARIETVERLTAALTPTGDVLSDDRYYGIAESVVDPASGQFQTNFRVHFTAYDVAPTSVRVAVDSSAGTNAYEVPAVAGIADLAGVALAVATDPSAPTTNTITVQAMCGPDPCGPRVYTGIVADIASPTYEFVRASLCANGVPLVPTGCDPSAAIAGAGNPAVWNLARDIDHDGGTGFGAQPIVVATSGLEEGRTVRLVTDVGSLANDTAPATSGSATFAELIASHLPGSEIRRIGVSFTDRAGNPAEPAAGRIDAARESIYARTDVIAPRGVVADVCIGESTGTDAASLEAGTCAAACAATGLCSRTAAAATLSWTAPGDDDGAGTVVSYFIGVAALGIDYGSGVLTSCADLGTAGYERLAVLPTAPQAGGAVERLGLDELYPHRDYCVVVAATDEVGNEGPRTVVARRKIPLVTVPTHQPFDGVVRDDAQAVGAFRSEPAAPQDYGAFATSLPDLDADGRDDFAVTQLTSGSVQLFLSGSAGGAFVPAVTINAPAIAYSGSFGVAVAGGDFDDDGLNDLVICDPTLTTIGFPQSGARGGALFLYYGVLGTGIARTINTTTPQVPSIHPDVSLLGAAGQELCANAAFAGHDLVATTGPTSNAARGFGIHGGTRARLPAGPNYFDVASAPDDALAVVAPHRLAVGDFDADGAPEAVISDQQRLYAFDGATLTATVDVLPGAGFGNALATVRSPGGAAGDWLLVGTTDGRVAVFAPGFMSDPTTYTTLDGTDWNGTASSRFGRSLASLGNFDGVAGADIVVGPGTDTSGPHSVFVYSFDSDAGVFEKRAILQGGAGFGSTLVGVRGYTPGSPLGRSQLLVVQRFAARLFMFR